MSLRGHFNTIGYSRIYKNTSTSIRYLQETVSKERMVTFAVRRGV